MQGRTQRLVYKQIDVLHTSEYHVHTNEITQLFNRPVSSYYGIGSDHVVKRAGVSSDHTNPDPQCTNSLIQRGDFKVFLHLAQDTKYRHM